MIRPRRRVLRLLALLLLALPLAGVAWLGFVWPPPSWWRSHDPAQTAFMRLRARQYARQPDAPPRRYEPVALEAMTPWLARAATTAEDDAFYDHHGIDWRSLRAALGYRRPGFRWGDARDRAELWRALGHALERRDQLRGASTITQQLAKNLYLSPSRNPLRKVKEAVIAWRLETALSKDRILELYLNVAELGPNVWGVEAASQYYFRRPASRVTLEQAALLAGTLPHPLTSNPSTRPGRARYRQELILRRLRGEPVELPPDPAVEEHPGDGPPAPIEPAPPLPALPDSIPAPRNDTAAAGAPAGG